MKITRVSPLTNKEVTLDLDVTQEQMNEFNSPDRRKIQDLFSNLNPADREFIKTGYTSDDWDYLFPPDND